MARFAALGYGCVAYLVFLATIVYAIGFVGNLAVPKSIDTGPQAGTGIAWMINALLVGLFALQHAIMARPAFKAWWTRFVPAAVERSTFVLTAGGLLALLMWQWRPMPGLVWHVEAGWARSALTAVSLVGWALVFYSSFVIDHFDLFGLRQVWLYWRGRPYTHRPFAERSLYRYVRHPLMLGFLVAFWVTPDMTTGHALFAGLFTAYIMIGVRLEERDLLRLLGQDYAEYCDRTSRFLPQPPAPRPAPGPEVADR